MNLIFELLDTHSFFPDVQVSFWKNKIKVEREILTDTTGWTLFQDRTTLDSWSLSIKGAFG